MILLVRMHNLSMWHKTLVSLTLALVPLTSGADTLGFVEQKFSDLHFEKGKWSRTAQLPCYAYVAQEDGAAVDVLRIGMNQFVPFKARKGLKVTVCGSIAVFDEGFEAGLLISSGILEKK
jgi:hypothetical protein